MTANAPKIYDLVVEDVEYLRHGDQPLLAPLSQIFDPSQILVAARH